MDDQQTMFRAFALPTGSINIFSVDLVFDTRSINTLSLQKAQSYKLTMFLNILKRGPIPPQKKKLRIQANYTHCTYNFNAKVTDDFFQNPLPADQQLGR